MGRSRASPPWITACFSSTPWARTFSIKSMSTVLPRLFIGLVAYLAFISLKRISLYLAWIAAGLLGTLTNTVLGMALYRGYITMDAVATIIPQFIAEAVIAIILTIAVVRGVDLYKSGKYSWYTDKYKV